MSAWGHFSIVLFGFCRVLPVDLMERYRLEEAEVKIVIKDREKWTRWEAEFVRGTPTNFSRNLDTFEELHSHAEKLGALRERGTLEGMESVLRLAKVLND